jgi:hypothetical protein
VGQGAGLDFSDKLVDRLRFLGLFGVKMGGVGVGNPPDRTPYDGGCLFCFAGYFGWDR